MEICKVPAPQHELPVDLGKIKQAATLFIDPLLSVHFISSLIMQVCQYSLPLLSVHFISSFIMQV